MTTIIERARFILPTDKELMFPAVSALQAYVNGYQSKMKNPLMDTSRGTANWELQYEVWCDKKMWDVFLRAGLELDIKPGIEENAEIDMVCDMSNERILAFQGLNKHAAQACGVICGVEALSTPQMRKVKPALSGEWVHWDTEEHVDLLLAAKDNEIPGIWGDGWVIYLAACMGHNVIELAPPDRPRNWLTKFFQFNYRVVEETEEWYLQFNRAHNSLMLAAKARSQAMEATVINMV